MTDAKERLPTAQWILERNLAWIAAADVKVGLMATLNVAMFGGLAAAYSLLATRTLGGFGWSAIALACIGLLASMSFACAVLMPNTNPAAISSDQQAASLSVVFFGEIAERTPEDYTHVLVTKSDDLLLADWARQIHRNAVLAQSKHCKLQWAMGSTIAALPFWLVAVANMAWTASGATAP